MDEEKLYKFWQDQGLFKANPTSDKKPYSLLMPPPNLTGELHLGHAMQHSILDALARFKRMQGFDVLLMPGVDHAGIQFEGVLNKLISKEGLTKEKLGRQKWMERAWQLKEEIYKSFHKDWIVFGISADWSREVFTMDEKRSKAVFEEFKKYYDDGLVYKGAYIVQWCSKCGTAIEDAEMEYEERKEKLYYVKYVIPAEAGIHTDKNIDSGSSPGMTDDYIIIATARPETIYADTGIAVYPKHPKFSKFVGKNAVNPLNNEGIPIFEDKRVDKEFGTGALKITPGHDFLDYKIGKDHDLPIFHAINKTGRMTELAKDLVGLKIAEAREKSAEILEKLGAIEKVENYTHSVPVCERCKTTVEPLISEEWFVKMQPLADKALKRIDEINFLPKNYKKILSDWIKDLKDLHDWCISRDLWWGHQIPVWYCISCNQNYIEITVKDPQKFISNNLPTTRTKIRWFFRFLRKYKRYELDAILPEIANYTISSQATPVISINNPGKCGKCKSDFIQDPQVLDTWFSSGLWPLSTLEWPNIESHSGDSERSVEDSIIRSWSSQDDIRYFPWNFEITAPEIKYLWIARMIMISLYLTDKIPFKNMFFHGMLRDLKGKKFSKSLGNGINPNDLREAWGTDATRMALYSYSAPGRDGKTSRQIMDERCKNFRNFGTKIKNLYRFIYELGPEKSASHFGGSPRPIESDNRDAIGRRGDLQHDETNTNDHWIIEELDKTIIGVTKYLESFQLHLATETLYDFIWHKFADVYVEKSKEKRLGAQPTLEHVFENCLKLLHPFMPFLTEDLWQKLVLSGVERIESGKSILSLKWPAEK